MSNTKALKHRVRSVASTKQITKAMELVAASKLRRIQDRARASRAYSQLAYSMLHKLAHTTELRNHPYFVSSPKVNTKLYVVFSSDRGLAGAFNSNIQLATLRAIEADKSKYPGIDIEVVVFGRRGGRFFAKTAGLSLKAVYDGLEDIPPPAAFAPLYELVNEGIKNGHYQAVSLVYTEFISSLAQHVQLLDILPITSLQTAEASAGEMVYELEPMAETVVDKAAELYLDSQIVQAKADSAASEYAMRMVAMSSASKNAGDLIDNLTLELNATRQAAITQEIAEITGGVEAMA